MRSRCVFPRLDACERSSISAAFGGDKICLLSSKLLPIADGSYKAGSLRHCSKSGSRSAPRLHEQSPQLLLQSLRSRNDAILEPPRSSLQSHVGDLSRRLAVSCSPRSSSPVSALYVLRRRSLLPRRTRFSNLGRSSSRTNLA